MIAPNSSSVSRSSNHATARYTFPSGVEYAAKSRLARMTTFPGTSVTPDAKTSLTRIELRYDSRAGEGTKPRPSPRCRARSFCWPTARLEASYRPDLRSAMIGLLSLGDEKPLDRLNEDVEVPASPGFWPGAVQPASTRLASATARTRFTSCIPRQYHARRSTSSAHQRSE